MTIQYERGQQGAEEKFKIQMAKGKWQMQDHLNFALCHLICLPPWAALPQNRNAALSKGRGPLVCFGPPL